MTPWRKKLLWIGLPMLAALVAANHAEQWLRAHEARKERELLASVTVRAEEGPGALKTHNVIGIEESSARADHALFLTFSLLGQWQFDPKSPTSCPPAVAKLSGRDASCIGFMYPLEPGARAKTFCLLRTTQTCCYGPRPQYSQYLFVEMKEPVKFERLAPVLLRGKFFPDPQPEQGFIYRMEGESVTPVAGDEPDLDPAAAAKDAGLPLFDFAPLAAADNASRPLPESLLALDGRRAVVGGFFVRRYSSRPPRILVGRLWWDGISQGTPPGFGNAVMVFPSDASELPPVWKDRGAFAGVLRVERNPDDWSRSAIVSLRDAKRLGARASGAAPLVPVAVEAALLAALLSLALIGGRRGAASVVALLLVGAAGESFGDAPAPAKSDPRVVMVNGEAIRESDLALKTAKGTFELDSKEARGIRLERMVDALILRQFLRDARVVVTDAEVDARVDQMRKNPPSAGCPCCRFETLEQFMSANYLDLKELRGLLANEIGLDRYVRAQWDKECPPGPAREAKVRLERPRIEAQYVKLSHVFFKTTQNPKYWADTEGVRKEAMAKARSARDDIRGGKPFETVAKAVSEDALSASAGGSLGCVLADAYGKDFARAVAALKPGEVSAPFESAWGCHVVRREALTDDDVLGILKKGFEREKSLSLLNNLKSNAKVLR